MVREKMMLLCYEGRYGCRWIKNIVVVMYYQFFAGSLVLSIHISTSITPMLWFCEDLTSS